jgi:hypothetical protein
MYTRLTTDGRAVSRGITNLIGWSTVIVLAAAAVCVAGRSIATSAARQPVPQPVTPPRAMASTQVPVTASPPPVLQSSPQPPRVERVYVPVREEHVVERVVEQPTPPRQEKVIFFHLPFVPGAPAGTKKEKPPQDPPKRSSGIPPSPKAKPAPKRASPVPIWGVEPVNHPPKKTTPKKSAPPPKRKK